MILFEASSFEHPNPPAVLFLDFVTLDLLVMLGMLVGPAGDFANDAGDVDGLVENTSISRETAVKYNILPAWTKNGKKNEKKINPHNSTTPFLESLYPL